VSCDGLLFEREYQYVLNVSFGNPVHNTSVDGIGFLGRDDDSVSV
jgi:hypothetical protein